MSNFDPSVPDAFTQFIDGTTTVSAEWLNAAPITYGNLAEAIDTTVAGDIFVLNREMDPTKTPLDLSAIGATPQPAEAMVSNGSELVVAGSNGAGASEFLEVRDRETLAVTRTLEVTGWGGWNNAVSLAIHGQWLATNFGGLVSIYDLDAISNEAVWNVDHGASVVAIDVDASRVYMAGARGAGNFNVRAVDRATGGLDWGVDLGVVGLQNMILSFGDTVMFGGNDASGANLHLYQGDGTLISSRLFATPITGFSNGNLAHVVTSSDMIVVDPANLTILSIYRGVGSPVHADDEMLLAEAGQPDVLLGGRLEDFTRLTVELLTDDLTACHVDGDLAWIATTGAGAGWNLARVELNRRPRVMRHVDLDESRRRTAGRTAGAVPLHIPVGNPCASLSQGTGAGAIAIDVVDVTFNQWNATPVEVGMFASDVSNTITTLTGGVYRVAWAVSGETNLDGFIVHLAVHQDGVEVDGSRQGHGVLAAGSVFALAGSCLVECGAEDVLELVIGAQTGANFTPYRASLTAERVTR